MNDLAAPRRTRPSDAVFSQWRAQDGWPLRRMDWAQPPGVEARGSLIFASGRGDFIEKYLEIYGWWHSAGWNVTAFDWRGQGHSRGDIVGGNLTDFGPLIEDFGALIADWRAGSPGPHVAVGHSMGGHLLLRTLVDKRPALDAAVLIAPMLLVNSKPIPPVLSPWIAGFMSLIGRRDRRLARAPTHGPRRQRALTGSSPERYEDETWWWGQEPAFNIGVPSWGWLRAAFRSAAATFTPAKLAEVELPVLILATEIDRLVSIGAIRRAAALLPQAELHVYPDAAHEILREGDPIRLDALERIDAFLAGRAR
ncbi:alpha/beta hydrolase [Sphingosinicella sp. LHD-64]|uniref:alpha/beta hydrolase n=1 Tax=Sphingosinicella sp. LHD-64 TaxID=3072139 RepID=UPI00281085F5|nr:alpha/beta hydrolase [Sphingosinicella sp. LHD-64]MDQ8755389.1 alpha/beta hydrolase [Sphingosinicella sp. LHD-64]